MSILLFSCWIAFHTLLVNIAIKAGWDFDPGYIGPAIIVFILNINLALYASKTNVKS
jgi:hypothetical protein